jgi:hypothetical protein
MLALSSKLTLGSHGLSLTGELDAHRLVRRGADKRRPADYELQQLQTADAIGSAKRPRQHH